MNLLTILKRYKFLGSEERSISLQINIVLSVVFKGISILISLLIVPMTLNYLKPVEYGIWLTLSSIITWIYFFDVGLGNGLRNNLAQSLAVGDHHKSKELVSTTLAMLIIIILSVLAAYFAIHPFLDWTKILNIEASISENINHVVLIVFIFFSLQFIFKTVGTIFTADQKPAANELVTMISSILSLASVLLLKKLTDGSLLNIAFVFSAVPALVFIITYIVMMNSKYKFLKPEIRYINWTYSKSLMSLGIKFFVLQIAGIVLYFSSNIIIAQIFSPYEVTVYNIAFKYANLITTICLIVITPLWSASTNAYLLKDWKWFKDIEKKMLVFFLVVIAASLVLIMLSSWFYELWIGDTLLIPFSLTVSLIVYNLLFVFSSIYIYMLNGIGKIKLQLLSAMIEITLTIPLCVLLGNFIGVKGVAIGMSSMLLLRVIWAPIQYHKVINRTATGIWNK